MDRNGTVLWQVSGKVAGGDMPPRFGVFVDAGYLLAAGGWATVGTWKRDESVVRLPDLVAWLQALVG